MTIDEAIEGLRGYCEPYEAGGAGHSTLTAEIKVVLAGVKRLREDLKATTCPRCEVDGYWYQATKIAESKVERVQANLLRKARLYQADDGSPGPLSGHWGWREIAKNLRIAAKAAKGE